MDTPRPPSPVPLPVIIDTDPGIDDMLALFLALQSPELDVRGISTSYGNTEVEHAHRNAVEILRLAKQRVRLAVGARRPLIRALAVARETHGESGLGYAAVPPAGVILDFVRPLDRLLAEQDGPVTLVTLGPLTSFALALRRDPDLVRAKVARHIAMVGTFGYKGNTTPMSEFNAWCDPEALDAVLRAQLPSHLVGLNVTRHMSVATTEIERLGRSGTPLGTWIGDAVRFYADFQLRREKVEECVVHDVLPIAALIRPAILTFEQAKVLVDKDDDQRRGRTREDPEGADAFIATQADTHAAHTLLIDRVFRWAATPVRTMAPVSPHGPPTGASA